MNRITMTRDEADEMKDLSGWDSRGTAKRLQQIERQHDHLVALIELLIQRDAAQAPTQELSGLLQELHAFIKQHFDDEEQYMLATEYPRLDTHRVIHRELLARLHDHVQRFERGQRRLGNQILSFLRFWLSAHITGQDPEVRASAQCSA